MVSEVTKTLKTTYLLLPCLRADSLNRDLKVNSNSSLSLEDYRLSFYRFLRKRPLTVGTEDPSLASSPSYNFRLAPHDCPRSSLTSPRTKDDRDLHRQRSHTIDNRFIFVSVDFGELRVQQVADINSTVGLPASLFTEDV